MPMCLQILECDFQAIQILWPIDDKYPTDPLFDKSKQFIFADTFDPNLN
jgi:hypothetical protein